MCVYIYLLYEEVRPLVAALASRRRRPPPPLHPSTRTQLPAASSFAPPSYRLKDDQQQRQPGAGGTSFLSSSSSLGAGLAGVDVSGLPEEDRVALAEFQSAVEEAERRILLMVGGWMDGWANMCMRL